MAIISGISKLKNADNFIQVSYLHGYEYIDNAGKILNFFTHKTDNPVQYSIGVNQLLITEPESGVAELKVSSENLWLHFNEGAKLTAEKAQNIVKTCLEYAQPILPIINIETISRLGWRAYFVYDTPIETSNLNKLKKFTHGNLVADVVTLNHGDVAIQVQLNLLRKKGDEKKTALLFDVDAAIMSDFKLDDLRNRLTSLQEEMQGETLLGYLNDVLAKYGA